MSGNSLVIWRRVVREYLLVITLALLSGCASFDPVPMDQLDYLSRAETQEQDGVRVTVSVLTRDEARKAFGKKLDKNLIQPVWVEIENRSEKGYWFMLHSLDPDYFSVREAALASHSGGKFNRDRIDEYFDDLGIDMFAAPGETVSGFVFSNLKQGTKRVRLRLLGERDKLEFEFYISVPGLRADWQRLDFEALYAREDYVDIEDPLVLRELLEEFMCCTTKKDGTGSGDPINLVVVAAPGELTAFIKAGWDETEIISMSSSWRTFKAFVAASEYKYSPISALYVFERPQDVSLQKARDTIHERNHLRLWLSPWRFRGDPVWIGGISRDIGVFMTTRTWNLTTHAIDSQVDEARSYIFEDLASARAVESFTMVNGVGASTSDNPRENLLGTDWWSDGRRAVIFLAAEPVDLDEIRVPQWGRGPDDIVPLETSANE